MNNLLKFFFQVIEIWGPINNLRDAKERLEQRIAKIRTSDIARCEGSTDDQYLL